MSLPNISELPSGYNFDYPEHEIRIQATRLKAHSDGRVTGELVITTSRGEFAAHLHQAQFNFSAGRSRKELAKLLFEQEPKLLPQPIWAEVLEQLCVHTLRRIREGDPAKELLINPEEDVTAPNYLLEPIIMEGVPTIIFGEKGVNKTLLALLFSISLSLPWHDNPLGFTVGKRPVKALILDWEQEEDIVRYYAKRIQLGMHLPSFPILYRHCAAPLINDLEQIQQHIADTEAKVVILDSLGAACGGELNKTEPALAFFAGLRKLRTTSLVLAQTSKDQDSKKKTIFGSTYFTYYARSIFELCKTDDINPDESSIALFHRWANYSRLYDAMGFHLSYNGPAIRIETEAVNASQFKDKINSRKLILETLSHGQMTVSQVVEETGISENNVRVILSQLKGKGRVLNPEKGKWGLPYLDT